MTSAESPRSGRAPGVNEADPRVKRTRKLLQDAFLELLSEKSFDAITVQEIAARSAINWATLYAHFEDKQEMSALAELNDHCRPTEALQPSIMSAVQEELSTLPRVWLAAPEHGSRTCTASETAVAGVSWVIFGAALNWSQASPRPPAEATADQIATLLTEGLSTVGC